MLTRTIHLIQAFQKELNKRTSNMKTVRKAAKELMEKSGEDSAHLQGQLIELTTKWDRVGRLATSKADRLDQAYREAAQFHDKAHGMLQWLTDAEQTLRYQGAVPDDEAMVEKQLDDHQVG